MIIYFTKNPIKTEKIPSHEIIQMKWISDTQESHFLSARKEMNFAKCNSSASSLRVSQSFHLIRRSCNQSEHGFSFQWHFASRGFTSNSDVSRWSGGVLLKKVDHTGGTEISGWDETQVNCNGGRSRPTLWPHRCGSVWQRHIVIAGEFGKMLPFHRCRRYRAVSS